MLEIQTDYSQAGQEAAWMLGRLRPHLTKQREATIEALVVGFRHDALTSQSMLAGIAMLSAIKMLQQELERLIRLGEPDQQPSA